MSTSFEKISESLSVFNSKMDEKREVKVLIADDLSFERKLLEKLVSECGYTAIEARDGLEALELFKSESPDIILMDIQMPNMDGKESARLIKAATKDDFVPIIFLTGLNEEKTIVDCMDAGGDDFLIKPYSAAFLKAKIRILLRTREMYRLMWEQKNALESSQESSHIDMQVAEKIISNIGRQNELLNFNNIKYTVIPVDVLSGDLVLAARTPANGQAFLFADFTGHGLPAAIGAMVVSEIFYSMISKGFRLPAVASEINKKLNSIMPTGRFMSACLLEVHPEFEHMSVVNAGMPDVLIRSVSGEINRRIPSAYIPLGILPNDQIEIHAEDYETCEGEKIYIYSDGLTEAANLDGELFGMQRLTESIEQNRNAVFEKVLVTVNQFRNGAKQTDDISFVEINCDSSLLDSISTTVPQQNNKPAMAWEFDFKLGTELLKGSNPVPIILHTLMEFQGLEKHRENLYTLISELYSNSLEHGILGLDSSLKHDVNGFAKYYGLRKERLQELQDAEIQMYFKHVPIEDGGSLYLSITDSGRGFDFNQIFSKLNDNSNAYGRGIALVSAIVDKLEYADQGKTVEVEYRWSSD